MKTAEQIKLRLAERTEELKDARHQLAKSNTEIEIYNYRDKVRRLEGNIGALEWVLREE
jgi:hypothetical protein